MFKALYTVITLFVGYNFKTALRVHKFHSPGSVPLLKLRIQRMFKVLHTIITPFVGYNFKTALRVHKFHSPGSVPLLKLRIQRMFKALHTIITPFVGCNFKTALRVHKFHSPGSVPLLSCLSWRYRQILLNISFASYRIPIYTLGSRAAMWINCLAEGQKCWAIGV